MSKKLPSRVLVKSGNRKAYYYVEKVGSHIELEPVKRDRSGWHPDGDTASSGISYGDYRYTHGGKLFQAAVDKAKELKNL